MYWDVVEVKPLEALGLFVRFTDGLTGEVRFKPEHLSGVFEPLKDPAYFKQGYVDHGTVAWPDRSSARCYVSGDQSQRGVSLGVDDVHEEGQ